MKMTQREVTPIEVSLLLEAVRQQYGYDFSDYSRESMTRRVAYCLSKYDLSHTGEMQHRILHDQAFFEQILLDFTVNITAMFRDPTMYCALRRDVFPVLRGQAHGRVWHAGCATGEEVYSLAILLHEGGLLEQTRQYATDINERVLRKARLGVFPIDRIPTYTRNYQEAGGQESLSAYYTADDDGVLMARRLRKNLVFSDHNLVRDGVFAEVDLILCRNVLIYFGDALKVRVLGLFARSLDAGGFLCLGSREHLIYPEIEACFEVVCEEEKIYRRTKASAP